MLDVWSGEYSPDALPSRLRAAPAKNDTLSIDPGTSNSVESLIGLPVCRVSVRAMSSDISVSSAAHRVRTAERSPGAVVDQSA